MSTPTHPASPPVRLRGNRNFLLLWAGAGFTMLAARMSGIALPLLVIWRTGSAWSAGLVGFAALLPNLLVQLPAGALVDRWDRRRLMIYCDLGCLLATGSVAAAVLANRVWLPHLMLATFIQGSLAILYRLGERAGIRHLVPPEQLPAAITGNEARTQASGLLGQPLGSVLFTVGRWLPMVGAAVAHAVSLVCLLAIGSKLQEERDPAPRRLFWREVTAGLTWIWQRPFLRAVMGLVGVSNLLFQAVSLALIVIVHDSGGSPRVVGLITAAAGLGGVLGALSSAWWLRRLSLRAVLILALLAWALLIAGLANTHQPVLLGLDFAMISGIGGVSNTAGGVYQMRVTPDALQGRVNSVLGLIGSGCSSVGVLLGGLALQSLGSQPAVLGVAALMGVLALLGLALPAEAPVHSTQPAVTETRVAEDSSVQ
ncbi:MFS transporter [Frankia sp. Ag45/Mut15]|uniref:MFS transporter n=1 Tax=Frankia umida TaxID=573489 RepID=A0ABT0K296_9ACTN|nr:MFS transporter [Frankia umida]MCK9877836.1 MFS transporter [Frankia umida]